MDQMRTVEDDIASPIVASESLALKKTGAGGIDALSNVLGEILDIMRQLATHLHVHVDTADALGKSKRELYNVSPPLSRISVKSDY